MKTYKIIILVILALVLDACGNITPTPTYEQILDGVYTAVAMTFVVQANTVDVKSTPTPISLPTLFLSPTLFASVTPFPTATMSSYTGVNSCYGSVYVSDVTYTDGTEIAPGETFVKTWELQNTGSCAWDDDYLLTFYSDDDMDGDATAIDEYVESGDVAEVSSDLSTFTPMPTTTSTSISTSTSIPTSTPIVFPPIRRYRRKLLDSSGNADIFYIVAGQELFDGPRQESIMI